MQFLYFTTGTGCFTLGPNHPSKLHGQGLDYLLSPWTWQGELFSLPWNERLCCCLSSGHTTRHDFAVFAANGVVSDVHKCGQHKDSWQSALRVNYEAEVGILLKTFCALFLVFIYHENNLSPFTLLYCHS